MSHNEDLRMLRCTRKNREKQRSSPISLWRILSVAIACSVYLKTADAAPIDLTYEKTQTYTGKAYDKDEHIWIYSKAFAEKFRMPAAWVSDNLKGIEAAAFRIGEMELTCGLGGNEATCARLMKCMLDIYVDEKKTPLPWLEDKKADWLPSTDSFHWLFDAENNAPGRVQNPPGLDPDTSGYRTLRPFGDRQAKRPAYYQNNAGTYDDQFNRSQIFAYQRRLHGDLSMIRLSYGCGGVRNKRPYTSFRLMLDMKPIRYVDDPKIKGTRDPVYGPRPVYHSFQLPVAFERKIDGVLELRGKTEEARYKQILNIK